MKRAAGPQCTQCGKYPFRDHTAEAQSDARVCLGGVEYRMITRGEHGLWWVPGWYHAAAPTSPPSAPPAPTLAPPPAAAPAWTASASSALQPQP
eukprot:7102058-Prymnesium_polylepis.2